MAAKAVTIARVVWFLACLGIFLYLAIVFLKNVSHNPVGTVVESASLDPENFPTATVCVGKWKDNNIIKKWPVEKVFPLGFLSGYHNLFKKEDNPNETEFDELLKQSRPFLESQQKFGDQVGQLLNMTSNDRNVSVIPAYLNTDHQCVRVSPTVDADIRIDSNAALPRYKEFQLELPQKFNAEILIALYSPRSMEHLLKRHFFVYKPGEWHDKLFLHNHINLKADITKYEHSKDVGEGCVETNKDDILPPSYEEDACTTDCVFEGIAAAFNCTPLPLYFSGSDRYHGRPLCHAAVNTPPVLRNKPRSRFLLAKKECVERMKCANRKACTEWKASLSLWSKQFTGGKLQGMRFYIKISFDPKIAVVKQFQIYTVEAILANLGGLAGMWLGLSIFTLCEMLCSCASKRGGCGNKTAP